MPVIDDLQIRIQGDAVKANDAIDKLIGKLDRLSTALSGLNGKNLSSLSTGVTRLSGAMTAMNNVKTADFTRLATNITKLANLDSGRIGQAAGAMHQFVNSLESLNNAKISYKAQQIAELSKGIAKLGYKSSTKAIENIPQLAQGMAHLMTTLSKAPKVSQNLIDMTNALAKLSRTGSSSGKAANSLSSALNKYTASTTRAKKGTFSLASAIGKLYATYWLLFRAFGKIKDAIDISSQLTEVQNVVDVTFGKYSSLVDKMSEISINEFGMSELTVKQVASRFQAMGTAMGFAQGEMADLSIELTKLTADMASFYNVEQDAVAEDLAAIFTGQTRPLRQYGIDLTQATLQEWALKQGMDANIKSMSQAEKTMLRYQYVLANTGAAQGDFLRTVDTWANQTRILKQNFQQLGAVIGGTFINALKPMVKALNSAMSHIIAFAKTVSNALGKIFGWTYEEGGGGIANDMEYAADSSEDLAGGLSNAEKNAKKLKSHLLGIDELNVLEPDTGDSSSGSGGGAGGTGGASADGGQWVKTDSILKNFESEIDTLEKLGNTIRDSLIKAMESIDWQSVYEKARGFGSGLAEFLNGLLDYDKEGRTLFGEIGKTLANTLNTVVYAAQSFLTDFDFYQFGVNLADGINRFFENFDFVALADSLNKFVDGLKETLKGAIETIELVDIYNKITEFLEELEIDTIGIIISGLILKNIISFKVAEDVLSKIGTEISTRLASVIASKLSIELANGAGISALFLETGKTIGNTLWMGISSFFGSSAATSALAFVNPIIKAFTGIGTVLSGLGVAVLNFFAMWENGFSWLKEALMVLGIALAGIGATILGVPATVAAVVAGVVAAIGTIAIVVKENWDKISAFFEALGMIFESVGVWIENTMSNIKLKFNQKLAEMKTFLKEWIQNGKEQLKEIPTAFKDAFEKAKNWVVEKVQSMYDFVKGIIDKIRTAISGIAEKISGVVSKVSSIGGSIFGGGGKSKSVDGFATGGFPQPSSLFWAGENGVPEILGTVGGRTAVAGGAEITGIRDAVYDTGETEATLLRTAVSLLEIIASKEMSVSISDRDVAMANRRGEEKLGYNFNF